MRTLDGNPTQIKRAGGGLYLAYKSETDRRGDRHAIAISVWQETQTSAPGPPEIPPTFVTFLPSSCQLQSTRGALRGPFQQPYTGDTNQQAFVAQKSVQYGLFAHYQLSFKHTPQNPTAHIAISYYIDNSKNRAWQEIGFSESLATKTKKLYAKRQHRVNSFWCGKAYSRTALPMNRAVGLFFYSTLILPGTLNNPEIRNTLSEVNENGKGKHQEEQKKKNLPELI